MRTRLTCGLAEFLAPRLIRIVSRRRPDFVIGGAENPYMNRWWLIPRNPVFNIFLHEFIRDDDDRALHDHPWWSLSLSLQGRLIEIQRSGRREIPPGSLIFRTGRFAHRLIVPEPGSLTLFLTGPRYRQWGFHCSNGWRSWKIFCAPGDKSRVGRGCD